MMELAKPMRKRNEPLMAEPDVKGVQYHDSYKSSIHDLMYNGDKPIIPPTFPTPPPSLLYTLELIAMATF
jgi:hypothetical protein